MESRHKVWVKKKEKEEKERQRLRGRGGGEVRPPILKIGEGVEEGVEEVVVVRACAAFWSVEVVLKRGCLEFILSCHAVSGPRSGISSCKD